MTRNQIDYERLVWISNRFENTYRHDEDHLTAREFLIALADWMDHEARPGSTITADTLRAIADAKPDPLDALSAEDRLGYALEKERHGEDWAIRIYIAERDAYGDLRTRENATAAAVVAEYERQEGGAK